MKIEALAVLGLVATALGIEADSRHEHEQKYANPEIEAEVPLSRADKVEQWLADPEGSALTGRLLVDMVPEPLYPDPPFAYDRVGMMQFWNLLLSRLYPPADQPLAGPDAHEPQSDDDYKLGESFLWGLTGIRDPARAMEHYMKAAETGDPDAQFMVGVGYATGGFLTPGAGIEEDQGMAILYYTFAAAGGSVSAQMALGYRYLNGLNVARNATLALEYLEPAGQECLRWHVDNDYPNFAPVPFNAWALGAEYGTGLYGDSAYMLMEGSVIYYLTHGALSPAHRLLRRLIFNHVGASSPDSKSVDEAVETLTFQAYEDDDPAAFFALARIYATGLSLNEPQYTTALSYALECLELQPSPTYASLCHTFIGARFMHGEGVEQNLSKAESHLTKARDHDDSTNYYKSTLAQLRYLQGREAEALSIWASMPSDNKGYAAAALTAIDHFDENPEFATTMLRHTVNALKERAPVAAIVLHATATDDLEAANYLMMGCRGSEDFVSPIRFAQHAYSRGDTGGALLAFAVAAEMGYEDAATNVADLLDNRHSVLPILAAWPLPSFARGINRSAVAFKYFMQAARHNIDALAKSAEHMILELGYFDLAAEYLRTLARNAFGMAYWRLGWMHEYGMGRRVDYHLAARNYELAKATPKAWLGVQTALFILYIKSWWRELPVSTAQPLRKSLRQSVEAYRRFIFEARLDPEFSGPLMVDDLWQFGIVPLLVLLATIAVFIGAGFFLRPRVRNNRNVNNMDLNINAINANNANIANNANDDVIVDDNVVNVDDANDAANDDANGNNNTYINNSDVNDVNDNDNDLSNDDVNNEVNVDSNENNIDDNFGVINDDINVNYENDYDNNNGIEVNDTDIVNDEDTVTDFVNSEINNIDENN